MQKLWVTVIYLGLFFNLTYSSGQLWLHFTLKHQSIVKWSQEGQSMVAFFYCKAAGQKEVIYFINRVILILFSAPLYLNIGSWLSHIMLWELKEVFEIDLAVWEMYICFETPYLFRVIRHQMRGIDQLHYTFLAHQLSKSTQLLIETCRGLSVAV